MEDQMKNQIVMVRTCRKSSFGILEYQLKSISKAKMKRAILQNHPTGPPSYLPFWQQDVRPAASCVVSSTADLHFLNQLLYASASRGSRWQILIGWGTLEDRWMDLIGVGSRPSARSLLLCTFTVTMQKRSLRPEPSAWKSTVIVSSMRKGSGTVLGTSLPLFPFGLVRDEESASGLLRDKEWVCEREKWRANRCILPYGFLFRWPCSEAMHQLAYLWKKGCLQ